MDWFRFYHSALHDPKVQRLRGDAFKTWINLLCMASEAKDRGVLPDVNHMAYWLHMSEAKTEAFVDELIDAGLIERLEDGRLTPHNWKSRQYRSDDVTARVRKHRGRANETLHETFQDRFRNVGRNGHETPRARADSESDSESPPKPPHGGGNKGSPSRGRRKRDPCPMPTPEAIQAKLDEINASIHPVRPAADADSPPPDDDDEIEF